MKIVSKFKDYYDAMRSQDLDKEPFYLRETKTFELAKMDDAQRFEADRLMAAMMPRITGIERGVIGFCGRLFPLYIVGSHVCFHQAALVAATDEGVFVDDWGYPVHGVARAIEDLGPEWGYMRQRIDDAPFIAFRAPVLWRRDRELVANPILKALQFQTQVDVYSAWQELSMFLGNNMVSASTVPPRPISDAERAETKGFDKKTSFRNQKNRPKSHRGDW
jgi:hypothetical protein